MDKPAVLLVLHDVAGETWADYAPFVAAVDALGDIPMTLLVVPDFHRRNPLDQDPALRAVLDQRVARGDELTLHGLYHADAQARMRSPRDWFMRRVYTWEGEFYDLDRDQALSRLHTGIELFDRHGWPLDGFVAPAWLMGEGTRQALAQLPLRYTSDHHHLYRLPDFAPIAAPGMVWSAGSAWRRGLSKALSDVREQRWRQASCIRLGLHPVDMRHPSARDYWLRLLQRLLADGRMAMTKRDWLATQNAYIQPSREAPQGMRTPA
jgi:predicted deacetylase